MPSLCHSPLTNSSSTRVASRRMPARSSTRPDATLRASKRPQARCSCTSRNATSAAHVAALVVAAALVVLVDDVADLGLLVAALPRTSTASPIVSPVSRS